MTPDEIKAIAEYIILSHTEDIEFLSVWEMTENRLPFEDLPPDELESVVIQVDATISKAKVSVTFEN